MKPEDSGALWLAGRCSLEKQQYDTATEYATRGIKSSKDDKAMYILLADIKLRTGRRMEAIAALQQGLQMTKGTPGYGGNPVAHGQPPHRLREPRRGEQDRR